MDHLDSILFQGNKIKTSEERKEKEEKETPPVPPKSGMPSLERARPSSH